MVDKLPRFWFRRPLGLAALAIVCLFALSPLAGSAQSRDLYWDEYNTTIDLHEDGSFTVTEQQVITFEGGPFRQGFAEIPLNRVEDITNVQVLEDGQPYQRGSEAPGNYSAQIYGGTLEILWWFDPATNESRNFTIQYDVIGGLRVYTSETGEPREQLWWRPIDTDFTATVNEATVTLNLPQPVSEEEMVATSYFLGDRDEPTVEMPDPQTVVWRDAGPIEPGDALEIRTEFPKMTAATVPGWQAADDARRAEEERLRPYKSAANLALIAAGLGLLIGGPLAIYGLWRSRGRDYPVEMPIDILREPPDDLSPGAVGTLVDEQADDHDVIAMIVDLAERGIIRIDEEDEPDLVEATVMPGRTWQIRRTGADPNLRGSERALLDALFGSSSTDVVSLRSVRARFASKQKGIKDKLYQELHESGYFPGNPQATRRKWLGIGALLAILSVCGGFLLLAFVVDFAGWVVFPIVVGIVLSVALLALSGSMPRKTQRGAEAASKWLAFKRYLEQIQQYEDLAEAKEIFAKYLPFAVAFKLERSWVRKFERVNTPAPEWYGPLPRRVPRRRGRWGGPIIVGAPAGGGGGDLPDVNMPDLQDMSEGLGGGLQGMSDGLFGMFNEASEIFQPFTSSGSSGGGRGSRGMTFGGGGFSGGGFGGGFGGGGFGGGGGGGSRGFS